MRKSQSYSQALAAVAFEGDYPVGFAYTADNVSGGNMLVRAAKRRSVEGRYTTFRELAVRPDYQGRGIAHALGYLSLTRRNPEQKVTAYAWQELERPMGILHAWGMTEKPVKAEPVRPLGETAREAQMYRLEAPSTRLVLGKILSAPGAEEAMNYVKRNAA
jgi:GNAT superfamily N-acetyltransferase